MKNINIINVSEGIINHISVHKINKIAVNTGFKKRKPIKITPFRFLTTLCFGLISGGRSKSLNQLASLMDSGKKGVKRIPSKQGLFKRISGNSAAFTKEILEEIVKISAKTRIKPDIFKYFNKVLIQDSTCFSVNKNLMEWFPGAGGARAGANIRIQLIWNWLSQKFEYFELTSYRENDQKNSPQILNYVTKGTLVIRDLGYYSLNVFKKIVDKEGFYLSRFLGNTFVYYQSSNKQIDLLKILKKRRSSSVNIQILLGKESKIPCRLIAIPLPENIVNKRRREAKQISKRRNHSCSKDHLELLAWNIFVTNVPGSIWTTKEIIAVYKLRWQIELIFKTWKSYFSINCIEANTKEMLETFIYAKLIGITIIYYFIAHLERFALEAMGKQISFMKTSKLITSRLPELIRALYSTKELFSFLEGLAFVLLRLCIVETRARKTTYELLQSDF